MLIILYSLLECLTVLVPVLLSVAFMTVIERKVMGSMQRRIGPNTVGVYGLAQPFADAIKLLVKEIIVPQQANKVVFFVAPAISMTFAVLGWAVIPFGPGIALSDWSLGILYGLAISSLGVYGLLFAGWAAGTKWAFLGAVRAAAQMISYELIYSSCVLAVLLLAGSYNLTAIVEKQYACWYVLPLLPVVLLFSIAALAETNRTPFDLVEAESELVSGFMTDHSSSPFVLFFLAEYCSIVLMSAFGAVLFLGGYIGPISGYTLVDSLTLGTKAVGIMFVFVWVRATLPRLRYDQLMVACWTQMLPMTFALLTLVPCLVVAWDVAPSA